MELPLEAVPNFSEGRDAATIDALRGALAGRSTCSTSTPTPTTTVRCSRSSARTPRWSRRWSRAVAVARERIDLRRHEGVHPRIGAADVVPLVPLRPDAMPRAQAAALARRRADRRRSSACPCSSTARRRRGRGPAFFRRGGPEALQRRVDAGELAPDFGPRAARRARGRASSSARAAADRVQRQPPRRRARRGAARSPRVVRETGGGFPGVRALGLELAQAGPRPGQHERRGLGGRGARTRSSRAIEREAHARGAEVAGSELVGLMPAGAAAEAAGGALRLAGFDASRVLELRLLDR